MAFFLRHTLLTYVSDQQHQEQMREGEECVGHRLLALAHRRSSGSSMFSPEKDHPSAMRVRKERKRVNWQKE